MRTTLNILSLTVATCVAYALMRGWLPAPLDMLPLAARGLFAIVVLALGVCGYAAWRGNRQCDAANLHRKPGWLDYTAATTTLLALHFGFLWLLGAAPPVIERIGIAAEPWLRPEAAAKRIDAAADAADASGTGNWLWQDRRTRALPHRGILRPGNRPEVFLRFDSPADAAAVVGSSAYVVSFVLSKFATDRWTTPQAEATLIEADEDGYIRFTAPAGRASQRPVAHQVFHGINRSGQNVLVALQGVKEVGIPQLESYGEGFLMLPQADDDAAGFQYHASSRPLAIGDLPQDLSVMLDPDSPDSLLEIPENKRVADYLRRQSIAIAGEKPTIGSLMALESWIRDAFEYSLETTNPSNLDPLENFLFAEQRGHCEHFAMTTALMLRSLGIPTRIAYGWTGGTWYESSQLMVFRAREAHAWTEFLLPDHGWIIMDTTPPSAIGGTRARLAPPDEPPPDPIEELAGDMQDDASARIDRAASWLLGIFGIPAALMLALRSRSRRRTTTGTATMGRGADVGGYLGAWGASCPPHHPGETLRQQIRRQQPSPPFANRLIEYHYFIHYTHADRDPKVERDLERAIREWSKQRQNKDFRE